MIKSQSFSFWIRLYCELCNSTIFRSRFRYFAPDPDLNLFIFFEYLIKLIDSAKVRSDMKNHLHWCMILIGQWKLIIRQNWISRISVQCHILIRCGIRYINNVVNTGIIDVFKCNFYLSSVLVYTIPWK